MAKNSKTPQDPRKAASSQAQRLAAGRNKGDNTTRNILIGVTAAVLALIIAVAVVLIQESKKTLFTEFEGAVPAEGISTDRGGIPFTGGSVGMNEDTPQVQVYLDFKCVWCGAFEEANGEDVKAMADAGEITVVYHPLANMDGASNGTMFSTRSAAAFAAISDRSPEHAIDFMMRVFEDDPSQSPTGHSDEELIAIAEEVGVPEDIAATITDGEFVEWVTVGTAQAVRDGNAATPTIVIDGKVWDQEADPESNWQIPGALRTKALGE